MRTTLNTTTLNTTTLTTLALLTLASGCLSWDEAPEGATGFLVVDEERLEGTVDGVAIDGSSVRGTGYCTPDGWWLELRAQAGGQDIMHVLEVSDLAMRGRSETVRFARLGTDREQLYVGDGSEAGLMSLTACAGPNLEAPDFEVSAAQVDLGLEANADGDVRVEYLATFQNGDEVRGGFSMEMPVTD